MDSDPTPSVSGQQDWEWNRLQAKRSEDDQSRRAEPTERRRQARSGRPRRGPSSDPAGRESQSEEATNGPEDQQLQAVIARYERLLDEKNRQLEAATEEPSNAGRGTALVQAARRLIARW